MVSSLKTRTPRIHLEEVMLPELRLKVPPATAIVRWNQITRTKRTKDRDDSIVAYHDTPFPASTTSFPE